MKIAIVLVSACAVTSGLYMVGLGAQAPSFKRTVLKQADLSVPGREVITAAVEFLPGGTPGRHSHPGEEVGYVIDGTLKVEQDGTPPVTVNAGEAFIIPAGTIHNATNVSAQNAHIVATYIVEKGKPMATPATQ